MYKSASNEVFTLWNYSQLIYYASWNLNCILERRLLFDSTALTEIPAYWDLAKEGLTVLQMLSHYRTLPHTILSVQNTIPSALNAGSFSSLGLNTTSWEIPSLTVLSSFYFAFICSWYLPQFLNIYLHARLYYLLLPSHWTIWSMMAGILPILFINMYPVLIAMSGI